MLTYCFSSKFSDILENYPRSPFLTADTDNFMDSRGGADNQGNVFLYFYYVFHVLRKEADTCVLEFQ